MQDPGLWTPIGWSDPEAVETRLRGTHEVVHLFRDAPGTRRRFLRPLDLAEDLRARTKVKSENIWSATKCGVSRATWFRIQRANYLRDRDRARRRPRRPWHLAGPSIVGVFAAHGTSGIALCFPRDGRIARSNVRKLGRFLNRLNGNGRRPLQDPDEIEARLIAWLEVLNRHTPAGWETRVFLLGPTVLLPAAGVCHPVTGEPWPRLYAWAIRRRSVRPDWWHPEFSSSLFEYHQAQEEQEVEGFDAALSAAKHGGPDVLEYVLPPPAPETRPSRKSYVPHNMVRDGNERSYRWDDVLRRPEEEPPEE